MKISRIKLEGQWKAKVFSSQLPVGENLKPVRKKLSNKMNLKSRQKRQYKNQRMT
jgi:hypothetical protein